MKCYECDGTGVVDIPEADPLTGKIPEPVKCRHCKGTGEAPVTNAALIAAAPDMRDCICDALSDLQMPEGMRRHFEEVLKQANGGKELPESKWKE